MVNKVEIKHLTTDIYDEAISSGSVLVDFWAKWCGPCRMVAPILEDIASEFDGIVTVAKVDIDNEMSLAVRYGIDSIPTVMLFKDGAEVKRFVGVQPIETYRAALK